KSSSDAKSSSGRKSTSGKSTTKKGYTSTKSGQQSTDENGAEGLESDEPMEADLTSPDVGDLADEVPDLEIPEEPGTEENEEGNKDADFVWDEEESEALRQARKDAELTASADSVRAYLKQIGKVALLNAEEEVELAKRIEAGLYGSERLRQAQEN